MRIGFDFDNTIVSYDAIFHKVAFERKVINVNVPKNKIAVRDYLRKMQREHIWTEMQGYVYGARMSEAEAYPHVIDVMNNLKKAGHHLFIVSHKTRFPYIGKPYDLHEAARAWIHQHLKHDEQALFGEDNIFFELTKEEKITRIKHLNCDIFIDDLPEILLAGTFPVNTKKFLFDPEKHYQHLPDIHIFSSWSLFRNDI